MKKLILLCSLFIGSLSAMESFKFKQSSVRAPQSLGNIELVRNEQGFHVVQDDESYAVKNYFVDPLLRNASKKSLKKFQKAGYIEVKKLDNEDFVLRAKVRGLGGGAGGAAAGFWIGRFAAQTVGYGIVALVALPALAGGPVAYSVVATGLAGTCAPLIESASHAVAIGTAIAVGTGTGPV